MANLVYSTSYTMLTVTWCHLECHVLSGLRFEAAGSSTVNFLFVQLFALGHQVTVKCDMNTLMWKYLTIPLFGGLVRCSAHGHLCVRPQYLPLIYRLKTFGSQPRRLPDGISRSITLMTFFFDEGYIVETKY